MTMLTLIQQATAEMGLAVPNTVAGNQATDVVQILALLNAVGYELQREYQWQKLVQIYQFTTPFTSTTGTLTQGSQVITGIPDTTGLDTTYQVFGTGVNNASYIESVDSLTQVTMTQAATVSGTPDLTFSKVRYSFPSGFDRVIDRTQWDVTQHWEMLGPETAQQWEWLNSGFISTGPRVRYRMFDGYFQIFPALGAEHLLSFEILTTNWASSSGALQPDKGSFTVDSDTCIYPDRLMVLGLKKKYFEVKGFDTTAFQRDYERQLGFAKSNDSGSPTLSFAPRGVDVLITSQNLPDSGFGM